ncbi:MAG: hypothetical protein LBL79_09715 [Prevotella sp.]|jgi:hypothetical protein|nr:hypothetical protein [Prevotella sp.]
MSKTVIATDSIILTPVKDGLTISMSPASCSISADFNGGNQNLDKAFTDLELFLGPKQLAFSLSVVEVSDTRIQYTITGANNGLTKRFRLTAVPTDILTGHIKFEFKTSYNEVTGGAFQFTVVRDVNTLDWIKDWENNKTKIGGDYLITPQLFVGKKVTSESQLSVLTGVYIGPEGIVPNSSAGIYGYKEGKEIFHINETGGSIGGWDINNGGIQTSDGCLRILSEGSIFAKDSDNTVIWGIYKSGEASFAKGNVKFSQDGSAYFQGKITSAEGSIGGWNITENLLYSDYIVLDSSKHYIGISPFDMSTLNSVPDTFNHYDKVLDSGGVAIHYTSANSFGIEGYLANSKNTFKLGSTNFIAGWNFDNESLYTGAKNNTAKQYTSASGAITIGTGGMRGYGWYIDANGDISFMNGLMTFDSISGTLLGWKMSSQRLSNSYVAFISEPSSAGLYLSSTDISDVASSSLESTIKNNSGIFLKRSTGCVELTGINSGNTIFSLTSSEDSSIAGWKFNNLAIYSGTCKSSGFTGSSGSVTIGASGIRGYGWRLEPDGGGALAGGNIQWDANGIFTFGSTLANSTTIENGLVLSKNIFVSNSSGEVKAGMSAEGSGETGVRFFAGSTNPALAPFRVDENGLLYSTNAYIKGIIEATSGKIGGFNISGTSLINAGFSNDASIIFRNDAHKVFAGIGGNVLPVSTAIRAVARFENNDESDQWDMGKNIAMLVQASGAKENIAIYMAGGVISGLALKVKQVSGNITVSYEDCYLSCYNLSVITITFPAPTTVGKVYYIRLNNSSNVVIDTFTSGGKQMMLLNGSIVNSITATTRGELITLMWDGKYWLYSTTAT